MFDKQSLSDNKKAGTIARFSLCCLPTAPAYCLLALSWPRHARPELALSTFDNARGAHRLFLVCGNRRDVAFLEFS
jgi:hypothetical protein